MWKISQFTIEKSLADRGCPDQLLVYNTDSRKCVLLEEAAWKRFKAGLNRRDGSGCLVTDRFAALGFIVPDQQDEQANWLARFNARRFGQKTIYPLIAVTTGCNIGCTYCYEAGVQATTMSKETIVHVLNWMRRRVVDDGVTEINPGLFGGEPLLYPELLFQIMDGHKAICQKYGATGSFYTSSNGMLLTPDLARTLARRGLRQIQISLDGPKSIHDLRRITKRGSATYDQSLRGLRVALKFVASVTLKINFDRQNLDAMTELLDFVSEDPELRQVTVKLEAIAYQMPASKVNHPADLVIPPESTEMADAYAKLSLMCKTRDLKVTNDTAHTTPCMFSSHHGVIIGPAGNIYKCISLVGRRDLAVGSVYDCTYDEDAYNRQMNSKKKLTDCFDEKCAYIPVCAGGCAYESVIRGADVTDRYCTKDYLERYHYLRHLIRHQSILEDLGMVPLTAEELSRASGNGCRGCKNGG